METANYERINNGWQVAMAHHNVYVIELDRKVSSVSRFLLANPQYGGIMPCVYVGLTGLTPEDRFHNHKKGYKSSSFVKLYGLRLRPDLFAHLNPMDYSEAVKTETELAQHLRSEGYGVWQK